MPLRLTPPYSNGPDDPTPTRQVKSRLPLGSSISNQRRRKPWGTPITEPSDAPDSQSSGANHTPNVSAIQTGAGPTLKRIEYRDGPAQQFESGFWSGVGFMTAYCVTLAAVALLVGLGWLTHRWLLT